MPIYEFECLDCGLEFEELVASMNRAKADCPKCQSQKTVKKVSLFSPHAGSSKPEADGCGMGADGTCSQGGCPYGGG